MVASIDPKQLFERLQDGEAAALIDVRTPAEYRSAHAQNATNMPLDQISADRMPSTPVFLICQSGTRARTAQKKLDASGRGDVTVVEGGTDAWEKAGLPVVYGRKTISLERQVRIGAGALVLIGAALGWFVHPAWLGLCAFVGAGLVFAGVTDTCGMAIILAKMPWNRAA